MRARSFFLLAIAIGFSPTIVRAQEPVRPFDRVDIGLYGAANVNRNDFHSYWDAGHAGALDVTAPFYVGRASLLVRVSVNDALAATSGFTSIFAALGWRAGRSIIPRLRADMGLHIGFTEWVFSNEDESSVGYELELGTEAGVRASFEFARRWYAVADASYQLTFTYEPIELAYVSFGIARSFGAPGWIRGLLQ